MLAIGQRVRLKSEPEKVGSVVGITRNTHQSWGPVNQLIAGPQTELPPMYRVHWDGEASPPPMDFLDEHLEAVNA